MTNDKVKATAIVAQAGLPAFGEFMRSHATALTKVMEEGMRPDRMVRLAIAAVSRMPALRDCTMLSIFESVAKAAEIGFEAGGALQEAYLVPFRKTCQLIIGYQGYVSLLYESGFVKDVQAHEVYEGDDFEYQYGTDSRLRHTPGGEPNPMAITHAYAIAHTTQGGVIFEVITRKEIDSIRARSKAADNGPWVTDYAMMCRKTALRRLQKWLPKTPKLRKAEAADLAADTGEPIDAGVFDAVDVPVDETPVQSTVENIKQSMVDKPDPAEAERQLLITKANGLLSEIDPALHKPLIGEKPVVDRSVDELHTALEVLEKHQAQRKVSG